MGDPLTEDDKYVAAWHFLRAAKTILPSSGSVSTGPILGKIEEAQEMVTDRRSLIPDGGEEQERSFDSACRGCGSEASTEPGDGTRAFVTYVPSPNGAQRTLEWSAKLPVIHTMVCTECGNPVGVIEPEDYDHFDLDELPDGVDTDGGFRYGGVAR